jgi:hypothetical protein
VAGIFARTDLARGVWKAPAGIEASLIGAAGLGVSVSEADTARIYARGVNGLRVFRSDQIVVWGARTLGSESADPQWRYIPVRRTALFLEQSLYRGTQWAAFEPNDARLWQRLRFDVETFMQGLFRQSAFQGSTPNQAYFVKCDSETTTHADVAGGVVNIVVGFAPLKPAEFVVIRIQQVAGATT